MEPLFDLGQIEVSEAAAAAIQTSGASLSELLQQHQSGDWHAEGEAAQRHNEFAARHELLVAAEYPLPNQGALLIVTAQNRSRTCVLRPDEYQYVEIGVIEGYARWADRYDVWKNPLIAVEEPVVNDVLQTLSFRTALDVGVGTGRQALRLAERGARVVGCDLSPEMLTVAQSKRTVDGRSLALVRATAEAAFPFPAEHFDLVLCSLMLSHVTNLHACLHEFARVQTRSGACLISEFHPEAIATRWRTSLQEPDRLYRLPNQPHTRDDYLDGLRAVGYRIRQVFDRRVAEVPEGYFAPEMIAQHGHKGLCLIILAERG